MKVAVSLALALLLVGCGSQSEQKTETNEVKKVVETKKVQEVKTELKEEVVPKKIATVKTGETLFKACSACHGATAEKKALGKSQVIKDWDVAKLEKALHGYKDGTYGGAMKSLMKGQASKLSDTDIEKLANYISKL